MKKFINILEALSVGMTGYCTPDVETEYCTPDFNVVKTNMLIKATCSEKRHVGKCNTKTD